MSPESNDPPTAPMQPCCERSPSCANIHFGFEGRRMPCNPRTSHKNYPSNFRIQDRWYFPLMGGAPIHRAYYIIILVMGTPNKLPPFFGKPHMGIQACMLPLHLFQRMRFVALGSPPSKSKLHASMVLLTNDDPMEIRWDACYFRGGYVLLYTPITNQHCKVSLEPVPRLILMQIRRLCFSYSICSTDICQLTL